MREEHGAFSWPRAGLSVVQQGFGPALGSWHDIGLDLCLFMGEVCNRTLFMAQFIFPGLQKQAGIWIPTTSVVGTVGESMACPRIPPRLGRERWWAVVM